MLKIYNITLQITDWQKDTKKVTWQFTDQIKKAKKVLENGNWTCHKLQQ